MILITGVTLPESVNTKATFLISVSLFEMSDERVIYCGEISCGQEFSF